jgi:single-strand DNA-binding protein
MASFNKVLLMGNLTRDPQLKYLPSQTAVVEFGIACNRKFRTANGEDKEEVTYVDITSFGKQAEVINQYFQKGKPIFIEGRLKFDSWEDKQGGGKRSKLTVVVENFQFGRRWRWWWWRPAEAAVMTKAAADTKMPRRAVPARHNSEARNADRSSQQRPQQEPPFSEEQQSRTTTSRSKRDRRVTSNQ